MKLQLAEWHRETFAVQLMNAPMESGPKEGRAVLVRGMVSGPFGIYPGTAWSIGHPSASRKTYTLLHMPTRVAQFTLPREGLCRQAASELASCDIAWESAWILGVVGPIEEMEKAGEIYNKWRRWGER